MDFKLPDIGEGVHEGEVVRWLVKQGDSVAVDQPLVEVMTDKATVEIPSPVAGKVERLSAKEGEVVKVGQAILSIAETGAAKAAQASQSTKNEQKAPQPGHPAPTQPTRPAAPAPAAQAPRPAPAAAQVTRPAAPAPSMATTARPAPQASGPAPYVASPGQTLATPATRRLARDLGVDLTRVPASGPAGRVTKEDVQRFAGASAAGPQIPISAPGMAPGGQTQLAPSLGLARPALRPMPGQAETLIPFRGIRRKIAESMSRSRTVIPEFTYVDECDVTELVAFRKEAKEAAGKQGVKLTYLPFVIKAMIRGLREYPTLNASLDEQGGNIVVKNYYNLGIAVDTENGLMVPVIKNADQKSILDLAHEIHGLAEKARAGKLAHDELQGGTITITNPGPIGGILSAPVINWPEVAIMGVHKIVRRPIVLSAAEGAANATKTDAIAIRDMMYLSIAVDHRVVDGATAARFMNVVIEYLASPKKLMLEMA